MATRTTPNAVASLVEALDALRRDHDALVDRVRVLETAPGPRDREDRDLRVALADHTRGLSFRVRELLAHAAEVPILAEALRAATIDTPDQLGAWLRDHVGARDGITVRRLPRRGWQVVHVNT